MENDELRITSRKQEILKLRKLLNELVEPGRSLTDEFIAERRTLSVGSLNTRSLDGDLEQANGEYMKAFIEAAEV